MFNIKAAALAVIMLFSIVNPVYLFGSEISGIPPPVCEHRANNEADNLPDRKARPAAKYSRIDTSKSTETLFTIPTYIRNLDEPMKASDNKLAYLCDSGDSGKVKHYSAPEAICVMDNQNICILDTYNRALRIYDYAEGVLLKTINIDFTQYPSKVASHGNLLYVLDASASTVYTIDVNLGVIANDRLPKFVQANPYDPAAEVEYDMGPLVSCLRIHDGKLIICMDEQYDYRLENGKFVPADKLYDTEQVEDNFIITHGENKWTIPSEGIGLDIMGSDEEGNLYVYCVGILLDAEGKICGDDTLRVYDKDSRLVRGVHIDLYNSMALPSEYICIDKNYNFLLMAGYESELRVMRARLVSDLKLRSITEQLSEANASIGDIEMPKANPVTANVSQPQALQNAIAYTSAKYTLCHKNQHNWSGITLHSHIKNANCGDTITGIPYARGGYNTISEFKSKIRTVYGTVGGTGYYYSAGDCDKSSSLGSAGVDCSGYASRVYGIARYTSDTLNSTVGYLIGNCGSPAVIANAHPMEFWVVPGEHVMLHSRYDSAKQRVWVYDASRVDYGKVVHRAWTVGTMKEWGFKLKNPWHSGSCTPGAAYESNNFQHWNPCTKCGMGNNYSNHTWIVSGSGYKCRICNRYSATNPGVTSLSQTILPKRQRTAGMNNIL